ncbi:MAG TPA: hypothetical protein VGJ59_10435 [Jatrophihabitantaceae bacterium]|jgi:hypothetical protein
MNEIEDALRDAMHAHDTLAPTTADFRFRMPTRRRGSPWLAAVAAAGCVLVVATVALVVSHRGGHSPGPAAQRPAPSTAEQLPGPAAAARYPGPPVTPIRSCPAGMPARRYWIPQPPKGIDVAKGLAPLETPAHAIVCAYLHGNHGKLTGTRTLSGDLSTIPAGLAWLPPAFPDRQPCAAYATISDADYYLMALSYRHGTMWLAIPGQHCDGASNGEFVTHNLMGQADSAYRTGRWSSPGPPLIMGGCPQTAGRLGQQDRFVPEHPVSLQLCRLGSHSRTVTATEGDLARLTADLNRLPTTPGGRDVFQCGHGGGPPSASYVLTFGYRVGPPVQVRIDEGCRPEIDNGNLQANDASSVLPLVHQLLGP